MKRLLIPVLLLGSLAVVLSPHRAQAVTCTVTFTDGRVLKALRLNGLPSCINKSDRPNIDADGIGPSQIKPTTWFPYGAIGNAAAPLPRPAPTGAWGPYVVAQENGSYGQTGNIHVLGIGTFDDSIVTPTAWRSD